MNREMVKLSILVIVIGLLFLARPPTAIAQANTVTTVVKVEAPPLLGPEQQAALEACVGEPITMSGTLNMVSHVTIDANGDFHAHININAQGITAVGQSGTIYRSPGAFETFINASGTPPNLTFPLENDFDLMISLIGPGQAPNARLTIQFHITINANGVTTAFINKPLEVRCQ